MGLNKIVDFSIAKLLKEKGFYIDKSDTLKFYHDENTLRKWDGLLRIGICPQTPKFDYSKIDIYQAPTIAEVVMWLYEKHGIWITPLPITKNTWYWEILHNYQDDNGWICMNDSNEFNSPTEAYEAAILFCLEKII